MLDAPALRRLCADALDALGAAREEIDALNVFPVPDGDTGTNLFLTMESAVEELSARPSDGDLAADLRALAHGALLGARGNSGVILSQLMRGAAHELVGAGRPDGDGARTVVRALEQASSFGYAAVARPVEGTMLTVIRGAAEAARAAHGDLPAVVTAAASGAHDALRRTPDLLAVLRDAGVVDAGGRGLTVLLDVAAAAVGADPGHPATDRPAWREPGAPASRPNPVLGPEAAPGAGPGYEVMFLVETDDAGSAQIRDELAAIGDSLMVVGGDGLWNVHVHVDDVGAAIETAVRSGRPYRIRVTYLADQVARQRAGSGPASRAVVVLVPGQGLAELARSCGALAVGSSAAPGGGAPATRDVLAAVQQAHASQVVLLPGDRETLSVAEAAAELARTGGLRVAVIPTRAPVQVLAAVAVHDPARRFDDDVIAMTAAARATHYGAVTVAVQVLDRMLSAGGELVTVVLGADADPELGQVLARHLRLTHPEVELAVHIGGQEHYPVLLGVE